MVERIHFFADIRRLVEGFAVGVGGGELEASAGVTGAELEGVVVGMSDIRLQRVAAEVGTERPAGAVHLASADRVVDSVLAEGSAGERAGLDFAGLAEAEAERRVAGVRLDQNALAVAGGADVACAEDGLGAGLALDGEHPLFCVGRAVMNVIAGNAADGDKAAPVETGVGMAARGIQRNEGVGKWLAEILSAGVAKSGGAGLV